MGDFWDPIGHQVLQTGGVVDSDTDQDDILPHRRASSVDNRAIYLQFRDNPVVSDGHILQFS